MTRAALEHIIRAAGTIANVDDVTVIGSQAVLGAFPEAPEELLVSNEADVFPTHHPERGELIDATIGEGSPFQKSFGYFAHGVDETTAILPAGWRDRLVLVAGENTRFVRGWCLDIHDLAIAKYVAGRPKDFDFTEALVRHGMIRRDLLEQRLALTDLEPALRKLVTARVLRAFSVRD
jgi:Nucleotidyltransferase of unknown function (DUF6036)